MENLCVYVDHQSVEQQPGGARGVEPGRRGGHLRRRAHFIWCPEVQAQATGCADGNDSATKIPLILFHISKNKVLP